MSKVDLLPSLKRKLLLTLKILDLTILEQISQPSSRKVKPSEEGKKINRIAFSFIKNNKKLSIISKITYHLCFFNSTISAEEPAKKKKVKSE